MPWKYYRKLIRDKIPAIIEAQGLRCRTRVLPPAAYSRALKKKIVEESLELLRARGRTAVLNELVDLAELLAACRRDLGVGPNDLERLVGAKRRARGGFKKRLFLEYTE